MTKPRTLEEALRLLAWEKGRSVRYRHALQRAVALAQDATDDMREILASQDSEEEYADKRREEEGKL